MINISQRVNYFFQRRDQLTASITSQLNEPAADNLGAQPIQPCFLFRTAFPLARKRRDSKQPIAFLQAFSQRKCMKGAARAAPFMASL
ncbi:hypothetical protein [Burkholderia gladioli]|uniref:hypothetical protein n=1 Tax=Burkholderia gladioli TaxID=28095 RepID=UPI000CFE46C1|nr:hypothetical protein [Burkholderia gladioli]PRE17389.1 hypothetical protein C6P72_23495 [Burkholderia gladioli]